MKHLDLTDVEANTFKVLPAGEYWLISDDAAVNTTKAGDGEYIKVTFKVLDGEYAGQKIFQMFNIENPNPKAVAIGLSQLKSFMKYSGFTDFNLPDVLDLVGHKVKAVVKIKHDERWGDSANIAYFKEGTYEFPTGHVMAETASAADVSF